MTTVSLYLKGDIVRLSLDGSCRAAFDVRSPSSPTRVSVVVGHPPELDGRQGTVEEVWPPSADGHVYFVRLQTSVKILDGTVVTAGMFSAAEMVAVAFVATTKVVA